MPVGGISLHDSLSELPPNEAISDLGPYSEPTRLQTKICFLLPASAGIRALSVWPMVCDDGGVLEPQWWMAWVMTRDYLLMQLGVPPVLLMLHPTYHNVL